MGTASYDHRANVGARLASHGGYGNAEPRPESPREWSEADFAEFNQGTERARREYERKAKA